MVNDSERSPGFLRTLPFELETDFLDARSVAVVLPGGSPALLGVIGRPADNPSTHHLTICYEWPIPHAVVFHPGLQQNDLERYHLDMFCTDHLLGTQTLPYSAIEAAADPPDFVVTYAGQRVGLDCAQFTLRARREAQGAFTAIYNKVLAEPRERFAHLANSMIYMWFPRESDRWLHLPHRAATDRDALNAVVCGLAEHHLDPNPPRVDPETPLPEMHPGIQAHSTHGCTFYGLPIGAVLPPTRLFAAVGFELSLGYASTHARESGWREIMTVIAAHDKPGIDHLLITVGGPNREGRGFLSEELMVVSLLEEPPNQLPSPAHLSRVVIHLWGSGRILELLPENRVLCPGLRPSQFVSWPLGNHLPRRGFFALASNA